MTLFTVNEKENGKKLADVFFARFPGIPAGVFFRAVRKRDVKINGARTGDGYAVLKSGDEVVIYIDAAPGGEGNPGGVRIPGETKIPGGVKIVYVNDCVIVAEKPQGLLTEPDATRPGEPSLIGTVRRAFAGADGSAGRYELCHRLDRNTGGLVFICRKPELLEEMKEALNARLYRKIYSVIVCGDISGLLPADGRWIPFRAFLEKSGERSRVYVADVPTAGARPIETLFRFVGKRKTECGLVICDAEAMLVTGRTHQIRAHLAHLGFPVAGDGKYGSEKANRLTGLKFQALWASRCEYDAGVASSGRLSGRILSAMPAFDVVCEPLFR